jgi:tetratricopeptide (TPR) repeat protein
MSPEQVRGEPVDSRSDVFAFGILLYRMVTGDLPFAGTTQVSTLAKILETVPEPPHIKNEKIPFELERIIEKCLQKNPFDRYQDTRDLQVDLRNLRRQYEAGMTQTMTDRTAAMLKANKKGSKEKKEKKPLTWKHVIIGVVVGPFAFLTVIVIAALIFSFFMRDEIEGPMVSINTGQTEPTQTLAILGFENKTNDTAMAWLQTGLQEILSTDLMQKCSVKVIGTEQLKERAARDKDEPTREKLTSIAKRLRADGLLSGSYYRLGDRIRIDARVQNLDESRVIMSESVVGTDPFVLIDSLTNKVAAALNLNFKSQDSSASDALASLSPKAYRPYREGIDLLYSERTDEAVAKLQEAVELDSTFALAHLRLGQALAQSGRQSDANRSLEAAKRHEGMLPAKEKLLVEAYLDLWLRNQFSDGKTKIASLVNMYPEDKELRTINGLLLAAFDRDSTAAFAQFDTALSIDPNYQFAMSQYASMLERFSLYERSAKILEEQLKAHPDAPASYREIIRVYRRLEKREEAYDAAQEYVENFPTTLDAYDNLLNMQIRRREFANARETLAEARQKVTPNKITELVFLSSELNLSVWEGRFGDAQKNLQRAVVLARKLGDTAQLLAAFTELVSFHDQFEEADSVFVYSDSARKYESSFQALQKPMMIAKYRPADSLQGRKEMKAVLEDLRKRLPASLWNQIRAIEVMYDGMLHRDTSVILNAFDSLLARSGGTGDEGQNVITYVGYAARAGNREDAIKRGIEFISGPRETARGMTYITTLLAVGIAEESLGKTEIAKGRYEEVLHYWGNADRTHPAIKEAKSRLARLRG